MAEGAGGHRGRGSASASGGALVVVLLCAAASLLAAAAEARTTYVVGDGDGWGRGVDYGKWLDGKTFRAGDVLVFNYNKTYHDVVWVSKGGYKNCIVSPRGGRAPVYRTGSTQITLRPGTHYFICGEPGHCSAGMKLAVTVV